MTEYNWWDDRTVEENDDMMCPIINYPCPHENCGECEDYKAFIGALTFDGSVKLEKDSNPFFIHTDLANDNPV